MRALRLEVKVFNFNLQIPLILAFGRRIIKPDPEELF